MSSRNSRGKQSRAVAFLSQAGSIGMSKRIKEGQMAAILLFARHGGHGDNGRHSANGQLARYSPMNEPIPFMSRCPSCGERRLQDGYTRRALLRLVNTHGSIEAYCIVCDGFWPVSALERAGIVIGLGAGAEQL